MAQLAEICHIEMGQSPPSSTYNTDGAGLPFLQGKGEFGELYPTPAKYCSGPSKIARAGAVLLSVRAPVGLTNVTPNECCIGRGLAAISPLGDISARFVLWALRNHQPTLAKSGTGSTFAAVSKAQVVSIPITLPPLNEQRRIVERIEALFDEIDRGVESLGEAKRAVGLYRQSLLKSAFEGRLTDDWRAENSDKLESPEVLLVRIREERGIGLHSMIGSEPSPSGGLSGGTAKVPQSRSGLPSLISFGHRGARLGRVFMCRRCSTHHSSTVGPPRTKREASLYCASPR